MYGMSIGHWIIVVAVVCILFGRGKITHTMKDLAKGIKSLKGIENG